MKLKEEMEFHYIHARNRWYCEIYYDNKEQQRKVKVGVSVSKAESFILAQKKYELSEGKIFSPKAYFLRSDTIV